MASEERDTGAISFAVPPAVDSWIDEEAARRGESRDDFCRRVFATLHAASSADSTTASEPLEPVERDDLEELHGRVDDQREEFLDLLEDVRARVIQVKRETDANAPADHEHPAHASTAELEALREDLDDLEDALADVRKTTDEGFDTAKAILTHALEELNALEDRTAALASTVVDLRDRHADRLARDRLREETERLQLAANQLGVRRAACEACSSSVTVSLLARPECPHCERPFVDVEAKSSLFGSHTLVTGDPPALEGDVGGDVDVDTDAVADGETDDVTERERGDVDE